MKPHRVMVPRKNEKTGKTYWTKIGSAWMRDGGKVSVVLDALPLGNELVIFPPDEGDSPRGNHGDGHVLGNDDVAY